MKVPHSWLRQLVDVDLPVAELVEFMGKSGLEVEEVHTPGAGTAGVRTARVLDRRPHPDADKLQVVRVTGEGGDGEVELVCGAWNFEVGDVVAHAPPGASIPGLVLEERPIRGVTSAGMICSARELELGEDHAGILVLGADTPLGIELTELLPVGEPVIEVAVQPDRGDHLSVLGVARDLAALLDTDLRAPSTPPAPEAPGVPVTVDTQGCERFHTIGVEDVRVVDSPLWLRQRLVQCGVRPIDAVVDVTNYVMLELGQPLHAFDLDRLAGPSLTVRDARAGETLVTLDERERPLVEGDMVIDDADGPASLAGVMGGRDSEVVRETTRVLLEGAVWDPARIRATSTRLGLVSEASQRFARGVDPAGAGRAVARAADLLATLTGGRATTGDLARPSSSPAWAARERVDVHVEQVRRLIAVEELDAARQGSLLSRAGCGVEAEGDRLLVDPPSWRWDLTRQADVAEEIARLHGYDRIPARLPRAAVTGELTASQRMEREILAAAQAAGFHEAVTRPFVGEDALDGVAPAQGRVRLANPLAKDASAMRPSMLEALLGALRHNAGQGRPGTALVEYGRIFRPQDDPVGDALGEHGRGWTAPDGTSLPLQPRTLGLAAQGLRLGEGWLDPHATWSVYDLLAVLDEVVRRLLPADDPRRLERSPVDRPGLHPGRTAALLLDGHEVGVVGQLHPEEAARRDMPEPVVVAELVVEGLLQEVGEAGHPPVPAIPLVRHPAMTVDVALVADEDVAYARLEDAVRRGAGDLLDDAWWFDEYRGDQLGEGRRSVAIRLRLQAPDRQLTDEDAERVIDAVGEAAGTVGATLRR